MTKRNKANLKLYPIVGKCCLMISLVITANAISDIAWAKTPHEKLQGTFLGDAAGHMQMEINDSTICFYRGYISSPPPGKYLKFTEENFMYLVKEAPIGGYAYKVVTSSYKSEWFSQKAKLELTLTDGEKKYRVIFEGSGGPSIFSFGNITISGDTSCLPNDPQTGKPITYWWRSKWKRSH